MESELSGGEPPLGQDMNGYLFLLSSHTLYVESGQLYAYNSDLATAIGGYAVGTVLGMTDGTGMWLCTAANNTTDPDAGGAGWVPIAAYGFSTIPVTGGTTTLTAAQSKYGVLVFTGALAGNQVINLPQNVQQWLVINSTTGAFALTVKTAAGGSVGVVVAQGGFNAPVGVYSVGDGNIYPTVAPLNLPIDQNPTSSTIVQRTNNGYVLATYFNGNANLEVPAIGAVFVENTAHDGFLRKCPLTNFEAELLLQGLGGQVSNGQVPFSAVSQWASALFASPAFTGVPTAPTAAPGTANTQVATTAFASGSSTIGGSAPGQQNSFTLPNGITFKWGQTPFFTGTNITVTFTNQFPTQGFIAMAQGVNTSNDVFPTSVPSTAGFSIGGGSNGITCVWFAIGR